MCVCFSSGVHIEVFYFCNHWGLLRKAQLRLLYSLLNPPLVLFFPSPCYFPKSCLRSFRRSSLIGASLLLLLLYLLLVGIDISWVWRRWPLHTHQLFYIPLFSRAVSHGILPGKSLNWLKSALLKLRVVVLLFALLLPLRILNCIISWSVQPSLPPTFTSITKPVLPYL